MPNMVEVVCNVIANHTAIYTSILQIMLYISDFSKFLLLELEIGSIQTIHYL